MDNLERTEEGSLLSLYSENGATKLLVGYDDDCCATSVTLDTLQRALNRYGLRIEGEISGDLPQSADDVFARYYPRLGRGEKSWLEVEMEETMALLRKKLERMNDKSVDELTTTDIHCLKDMWKTIYYIKSVKAAMK